MASCSSTRNGSRTMCCISCAEPRLPRRSLLAAALGSVLVRRVAASDAPSLPLRIESVEAGGTLRGAVQALSPFAFGTVAEALAAPQAWCEILMLHLNNKACRLQPAADGPVLQLAIARKHDQELAQAHALALHWRLLESTAQRLRVRLDAPAGPFGSTDYVVELTARPAAGGGTAIEFSYACRFGTAARALLRSYLATFGRDKVGFTTVPAAGGTTQPVGGLRGVVERTAVRYWLAIDAWLQAQTLPPAQRAVARLGLWFDATERYPRQLRELDRQTYLADKRRALGLGP